jgi:hypothetical protein
LFQTLSKDHKGEDNYRINHPSPSFWLQPQSPQPLETHLLHPNWCQFQVAHKLIQRPPNASAFYTQSIPIASIHFSVAGVLNKQDIGFKPINLQLPFRLSLSSSQLLPWVRHKPQIRKPF